AALNEKPGNPLRDLFAMLRADGLLAPMVVIAATLMAAVGVMIEALLFRGIFDLSSKLGLVEQRWGAMFALLLFNIALVLLEAPQIVGMQRIGRHLEARLRVAFLEKIPRLGDRYFRSRLVSDMVQRVHEALALRLLPSLGGQFIRLVCELILTTAGI